MKKTIAFILAICLLSSFCCAFAVDSGEKRAVIGADLTEENIAAVYSAFATERGAVRELTVTNGDEREYLEGFVDDALIGTKSISCVYIETLAEGEGLDVTTSNISWCTPEMYVSALATAGISDARVMVAAPFEVSGTAALTGVYMAYEDISGEKLDETAKLVGTQELTVTAELADQIGSYDSIEIVNELKLILDETMSMTDEELKTQITDIGRQYNVTLTESQTDQLISLCRQLEKLDPEELKQKVESVQETIKKMAEAKTKVEGFAASVKSIIDAIGEFFRRVFSAFGD